MRRALRAPAAAHGCHAHVLVGMLAILVVLCQSAAAQEPLHARIDRAIAARLDCPVAPPADDGEFVRRLYVDLTGCVPSAAETRAFLDDPSPDKRARLIDRLLASPAFARRMQQVFDLMLMERRPDNAVPTPAWQEYLYRSFLEHKPLNVLCGEILAADGVDAALRPAAKFYLDRGGEVNLITRDVGRIFFGMDLQCAQCHDHPLVSSYYQDDYYGLAAFFTRSFVFKDATQTQFVAEKADGEVSFKSVFIDGAEPQSTPPHLPGQPPLADPTMDPAVAYLVPPADGVRPTPRHSRRAVLAREATGGAAARFNRNLANRLWAMMLKRGLVYPVDFEHADNPPSHPELLDLLGAELAAMQFDVRGFLREIALSETYQRSSQLPEGVDPAAVPPERFAVAELRPLSPEEFAWSAMMVAGIVEAQRQAAGAQWDSDPRLSEVYALDARRQALREELIERSTYGALAGNAAPFAALFAGAAGSQSQDYQATVHQALFLANGEPIRSWLTPGRGNVLERCAAPSDLRLVAEDLYLTVLSRRPTADEEAEVAAHLAGRDADRAAALTELAWALLTSVEFRFHH
jgi:hypothetical protein